VKDINNSAYALDRITSFGVRPPELSSIDSLPDFLRWTNNKWYKFKDFEKLPDDLLECPWIDGRGRQVRILVEYLDDVQKFLEKRMHNFFYNSYTNRPGRLTATVSRWKKYVFILQCSPLLL
jgi:hypothetical protein